MNSSNNSSNSPRPVGFSAPVVRRGAEVSTAAARNPASTPHVDVGALASETAERVAREEKVHDDLDTLRALVEEGCRRVVTGKLAPVRFVFSDVNSPLQLTVRTTKVQGKWTVVYEGKNGPDGEIALYNAPLRILTLAPTILRQVTEEMARENARFASSMPSAINAMNVLLDELDGEEP